MWPVVSYISLPVPFCDVRNASSLLGYYLGVFFNKQNVMQLNRFTFFTFFRLFLLQNYTFFFCIRMNTKSRLTLAWLFMLEIEYPVSWRSEHNKSPVLCHPYFVNQTPILGPFHSLLFENWFFFLSRVSKEMKAFSKQAAYIEKYIFTIYKSKLLNCIYILLQIYFKFKLLM